MRRIDAAPGEAMAPIQLLASACGLEIDPHHTWSAAELVAEPSLVDQAIWLEGVPSQAWPAWRTFLSAYAHACRALSPHQRTLLLLPVVGASVEELPAGDVGLAVRQWSGYVSGADTLLHAAQLRSDQDGAPLLRRLALATIAQLALWDSSTVERLAHEPLARLLAPRTLLGQIAAERGWTREIAPAWRHGTRDLVDGEQQVHSARLALADPDREIEYRLWCAQIGILLPHIELKRRHIIRTLRGRLTIPFSTGDGRRITRAEDLEIGHIYHQVTCGDLRVEAPLLSRIAQLRDIRNQLSHLEPLTLEQIEALQ